MNPKTPYTIWLMGPTSSGKTTIAYHLMKIINKKSFSMLHFDGDEIRDLFGKDFGFEKKNRMIVVQTLVKFAIKSNFSGVSSVVSALTAHEDARNYIKSNITNLYTVYIKCPISLCARRDPKGLYQKAKDGKINTLIGYNSIYKPPLNPDLTIDTSKYSVEHCTKLLANFFNIPITT